MQLDCFLWFVKKEQAKALETLRGKGNDYAGIKDALSNFKYSGEFAGVTPDQACRVLIGTKLARLKELLNNPNKEIKNESIKDTLLDLSNYLLLDIALRDEELIMEEYEKSQK